ncbi:MAG: hypothetical protein LBF79_06040, partial [Dysgonamonadaceae bacterium]|nr:hypothetical protein [Dysgonamonadaceae bacterium]
IRPVSQTNNNNAQNDFLKPCLEFLDNHFARIHLPPDRPDLLDAFFQTLSSLENAHNNNIEASDSIPNAHAPRPEPQIDRAVPDAIHILHYGDSQIEGDRITGYLRRRLQERFGGTGPGLLPLIQQIPSGTVRQSHWGGLERYVISGNHARKAPNKRYGVLGQFVRLDGTGTVTITAGKGDRIGDSVKIFNRIRLFIGKRSAGFKASFKEFPNQRPEVKTINNSGTEMEIFTWRLSAPSSKVALQLYGHAELTAVSLDGISGLNVDNIPLRGSSGTFFTGIDSLSLQPALLGLNVGLLILQFGGNVVPAIRNEAGIDAYCGRIARQIEYFERLCPGVPVLFIGPSDMSTRIKGRLQTYPHLSLLIEKLRHTVTQAGAAFWDMYTAMGGQNSMIEWAKKQPPLASKDYIHFTPAGADSIAHIFLQSVIMHYDCFLLKKQQP